MGKLKITACSFAVTLTLMFIEVSCTLGNSTSLSSTPARCPSKIIIHAKNYFEEYLTTNAPNASGLFPKYITKISKYCCGTQEVKFRFVNEASRIAVHNLLYEARQLPENNGNDVLTLYFPVFTAMTDPTFVHKHYYFIELVKSPGPAFLMLSEDLEKAPDPSIVLVQCWPLFLLLIIMAIVVGILGWFLDHWKNQTQFPNNFFRGSWEGFWWAMVTMTTVGYGDKAPISFLARVLTVLWMITGTIVTSLFTANVATVLTTKNVAALQNVMGQKVGVLNSKSFYQREINEGASFIEYQSQSALLRAFNDRSISRLLVPNYLDHLYFTISKNFRKNFVVTNVIKHPFSIGLGLVNKVKTEGVVDEFLQCWERSILNNYEEDEIDYSIIDPSMFHTADDAKSLLNEDSILRLIYGLIGLLVVVFIAGSVWEYCKYRTEKMQFMVPAGIEMTKVSKDSF